MSLNLQPQTTTRMSIHMLDATHAEHSRLLSTATCSFLRLAKHHAEHLSSIAEHQREANLFLFSAACLWRTKKDCASCSDDAKKNCDSCNYSYSSEFCSSEDFFSHAARGLRAHLEHFPKMTAAMLNTVRGLLAPCRRCRDIPPA